MTPGAEPRLFVIRLPHPPKACHPNTRSHFMAKASAVKKYRTAACLVAMEAQGAARPVRMKRARVTVVAKYRDERARDKDNILASLKSAFDGLADAGLVENDRDFTFDPVVPRKDKADVGITIIVMEEL